MERKATAFLVFLGCTALFTTFYLSASSTETINPDDRTSVVTVQSEQAETAQTEAIQAEEENKDNAVTSTKEDENKEEQTTKSSEEEN